MIDSVPGPLFQVRAFALNVPYNLESRTTHSCSDPGSLGTLPPIKLARSVISTVQPQRRLGTRAHPHPLIAEATTTFSSIARNTARAIFLPRLGVSPRAGIPKAGSSKWPGRPARDVPSWEEVPRSKLQAWDTLHVPPSPSRHGD